MTHLHLHLPKWAMAFTSSQSTTVFAVNHCHHPLSTLAPFVNMRKILLHWMTPVYVCFQTPQIPSMLTKQATATNYFWQPPIVFNSHQLLSTATNCFQQPQTVVDSQHQWCLFTNARTHQIPRMCICPNPYKPLFTLTKPAPQMSTIINSQHPPCNRPPPEVSLVPATTNIIDNQTGAQTPVNSCHTNWQPAPSPILII